MLSKNETALKTDPHILWLRQNNFSKTYRIFIHPVIDYSSPISNFTRHTYPNSLKTVLRVAMGAFRTTLTNNFPYETS